MYLNWQRRNNYKFITILGYSLLHLGFLSSCSHATLKSIGIDFDVMWPQPKSLKPICLKPTCIYRFKKGLKLIRRYKSPFELFNYPIPDILNFKDILLYINRDLKIFVRFMWTIQTKSIAMDLKSHVSNSVVYEGFCFADVVEDLLSTHCEAWETDITDKTEENLGSQCKNMKIWQFFKILGKVIISQTEFLYCLDCESCNFFEVG